MNIKPLANAIIDAFIFLESADDSEVDPDLAVKCMENMSASLLKLSDPEQVELRRVIIQISEEEDAVIPYSNFVKDLPDSINLCESE